MFTRSTIELRVVETPSSRITLDTITRVTVPRSGAVAVRYNGRYHRVLGGTTTSPYIAVSAFEGLA